MSTHDSNPSRAPGFVSLSQEGTGRSAPRPAGEGTRSQMTLGCVAVLGGLLSCCATTMARRPDLPSRIEPIIRQAALQHAVWGIAVEDDAGRTLYAKNASVMMIPASNRKLFTAALAADCLGLDRQLPTELWLDGTTRGEAIEGNLVIRGAGDPSFAGRFYDDDRGLPFAPFLRALRDRGIRTVIGDVVADVSLFDRRTLPGSWKWGNLGSDYAAPVDAIAWNENLVGVDLSMPECGKASAATRPAFVRWQAAVGCAPDGEPKVWSDDQNRVAISGQLGADHGGRYSTLISVGSPGLFAAQALRDYLLRNGIAVTGTARVRIEPGQWTERLAVHQSPQLFMLLSRLLKNSQNLYGEMLYKDAAQGGDSPASYGRAEQVERLFLTNEVGIDGSEFSFVDGCGLSPDDLVTPHAIVALLRYLNRPERRALFWMLLAAPGEEGTLHNRLMDLGDRLRGKTGTINGVNALSGIVRGRSGGYRYFSVVLNHHTADTTVAVRALDDAARQIADF